MRDRSRIFLDRSRMALIASIMPKLTGRKESPMSKPKARIASRSAISGHFVRKSYAKAHPKTTVNERLPLPGKGSK